jgi:hypothetical protein
MPRQERTKSGTGIYHVMLRGINKQDIFEDDEDYLQMTSIKTKMITEPSLGHSWSFSPGYGIIPKYQVFPSIIVTNKGQIYNYYDTRIKKYIK